MSKDLEYEFNNFANLLNKDCMNLMECLKKQSEDNKPILYLGKHYKKVILPYEEYQKIYKRLESIDNANPSEALECLKKLTLLTCNIEWYKDNINTIKQALIKAEKEHNSVNLLMQELDCKDFADLRKYARCGYDKLNKKYIKWEDLEFNINKQMMTVLLNGTKYTLIVGRNMHIDKLAFLKNGEINYYFLEADKQFFNDLHLERVEE